MKVIGYYGKMKESEKSDAYIRWKSGEVPVTRAFGLGINKEDVRFVTTVTMTCMIRQLEREREGDAICYHWLGNSLSEKRIGGALKTKRIVSFWEHFHLRHKTCRGMLKT